MVNLRFFLAWHGSSKDRCVGRTVDDVSNASALRRYEKYQSTAWIVMVVIAPALQNRPRSRHQATLPGRSASLG